MGRFVGDRALIIPVENNYFPCFRDAGVGGSNPLTPTRIKKEEALMIQGLFLFCDSLRQDIEECLQIKVVEVVADAGCGERFL